MYWCVAVRHFQHRQSSHSGIICCRGYKPCPFPWTFYARGAVFNGSGHHACHSDALSGIVVWQGLVRGAKLSAPILDAPRPADSPSRMGRFHSTPARVRPKPTVRMPHGDTSRCAHRSVGRKTAIRVNSWRGAVLLTLSLLRNRRHHSDTVILQFLVALYDHRHQSVALSSKRKLRMPVAGGVPAPSCLLRTPGQLCQ